MTMPPDQPKALPEKFKWAPDGENYREFARQANGSYLAPGFLGTSVGQYLLSAEQAAAFLLSGAATPLGVESATGRSLSASAQGFVDAITPSGDLSPSVMIRPGDEGKPTSQQRFVFTVTSRITGKQEPSTRIQQLQNGQSVEVYNEAPRPASYLQAESAAANRPNAPTGTYNVDALGDVRYLSPYGGMGEVVGRVAVAPNITTFTGFNGNLWTNDAAWFDGKTDANGNPAKKINDSGIKVAFSAEQVRANQTTDITNAENAQKARDTAAAQAQSARDFSQNTFIGGENAANRAATSAENVANRAFTGAEAAANRAFTGAESATGRAFLGAENVLAAQRAEDVAAASRAYDVYKTAGERAFVGGESRIGRALSAGQYAATNALELADREAAAKRDALTAAKTYAELSAAPDLTGFQRFMQAGGGNVGNAILRGADSLTPLGQLGAGQALRVSRAPYVAPAAYANPFPNFNFQDTSYMTQAPFNAPVTPVRTSTFREPPPLVVQPSPVAQPSAPSGPANPLAGMSNAALFAIQNQRIATQTLQDVNAIADPLERAQAASAAINSGVLSPSTIIRAGNAYGTGPGAMPIYRSAVATPPMGRGMDTLTGRYAYGTLGTMGMPRYALGNPMTMAQPPMDMMAQPPMDMMAQPPAPSMNGGMSPFGDQGMPATGTFITGDSTDPMDPAAGGAQPEMVTLNDPEGNATADVIPMTMPGVGPDPGTDDGGSIGALLMAISKFILAEEAKSAVAAPPPPMMGPELGMMGAPRFNMGTLGMMGLPRYNMGTNVSYNMGVPRYALGAMPGFDISAEDQPYVAEVLATRRATPYSVNPFAADYQMQSPTARAIGQTAFQTATGVPGTELDYLARMYEPQGLARQSTYNQELNLGI